MKMLQNTVDGGISAFLKRLLDPLLLNSNHTVMSKH
ncbi:hypothetical protein X975_01674, partial [Stegodyphus mimosarum]